MDKEITDLLSSVGMLLYCYVPILLIMWGIALWRIRKD